MMESRRWLATGHSRTANARQRSNQTWAEITTALNSNGGCIKTWQQWSKYWKDKKGAVKRKASAVAAARRRTGGGVEDVPELTSIENRIVSIMGGESFATGDRHLEIDPFNEPDNTDAGSSEPSASILQNSTVQGTSAPAEQAQEVELYELQWNESAIAILGDDSVRDIPSPGISQNVVMAEPELQATPGPSRVAEESVDILGTDVTRQQGGSVDRTSTRRRILQQSPGMRRQRPQPRHSPGAGASAARRRLLRRSPPSQRRSEMASLTDRFIAIEERRAEAELLTARAQDFYAQGQQALSASVSQLAQAWLAHAQAINSLVETFTRNSQ